MTLVIFYRYLAAIVSNNTIKVDLGRMSSGMYTLVINDVANGKRIVEKIVK